MPNPKNAATPKDEANGEEQEPITPTEEASPPEAEPQEQRGEETPDPLDGVTFQQLQEHPRFKGDWENLTAAQKEEREKAYREGQSAGSKQADEDARQWAAQQEAIKTFDDLEQKRLSQDPDDLQEYAQAMGNPKVKDAYERGRSAKQGPAAEEIAVRAVNAAMTEAYLPLKQHPSLKGMTQEEHEAVLKEFEGKPQPYTQALKRYCELIVEKGTAAGRIADDDKRIKDAKEEGRREAYDEVGLEYPADEIDGHKPAQLPTKDELGGMSQEELVELEKKGKLDKILAGRK